MTDPADVVGKVADLGRAVVDKLPDPDPKIRRGRVVGRWTRRAGVLEARAAFVKRPRLRAVLRARARGFRRALAQLRQADGD